MRTVSKSATFLATESVNSAPFKRGEAVVQIFWQGKAQNSSPMLRCTFLARRSAKLIANFSATMVTSLPSFSLSLSLSLYLSLSLSPNVPHAQYRKRFRASYNYLLARSACVLEIWTESRFFSLLTKWHMGLASEEVTKQSNAWQRGKLVLNKDRATYKSMLRGKSLIHEVLFPSWRGLNGFDNSFTAWCVTFQKISGIDKCGAIFRSIDDLPAYFCMGRCLC